MSLFDLSRLRKLAPQGPDSAEESPWPKVTSFLDGCHSITALPPENKSPNLSSILEAQKVISASKVSMGLVEDSERTTLQISIFCPVPLLSFLSHLWHLPDQFLTLASRESACWPTNLSYDIDIHTWLNYSLMKYTGLACYYRVKLRPRTEVSSSTKVGKSPEPFIPFLQRIHWPPKIMNSWLRA
jgi:hypothetical protein